MPYNITAAVAKSKGLTLMPTYGLNVYSMLKHNTVVLTTSSLEKLESKLLNCIHNIEFRASPFNGKAN
jgi:large subunit ribosomal protein L4